MEWDTLKEEDGPMKVEEVLVTLTEEGDVNQDTRMQEKIMQQETLMGRDI